MYGRYSNKNLNTNKQIQILISNLKESLEEYSQKQDNCMRNLLYIYEQYPDSEVIDSMKRKFIKINEKATSFWFRKLVQDGLKSSSSKSPLAVEKNNKNQTSIMWILVNSDKENEELVFISSVNNLIYIVKL